MTPISLRMMRELNNVVDRAASVLAPVFVQNGWIWGKEVPDRETISNTLTSMVDQLIKEDDITSISEGRLRVSYSAEEEEPILSIFLELGEVYSGVYGDS